MSDLIMCSSGVFLLCFCYAVTFTLVSCAPGDIKTKLSVHAPKTGVHEPASRNTPSTELTVQVVTSDQAPTVNSDSKMEGIILSVVHQDASASSDLMTLPDDLVINALQSNIETLQDQLDFCEEGLMERINAHGRDHKSNYPTDADNDRRDRHDVDNSSRVVNPKVSDVSRETDASELSDKVGQRVHRNIRSASGDPPQAPGDSVHALARVLVERLSSRIRYLKKSVAECYVVYSKWNIRHT